MKMLKHYLLLIPMSLIFVSCGGSSALNSIVNAVNINQIEEDGKITLDAEFQINAPGITLPSITYPVVVRGEQKGTVSLISNGPGQNAVRVSANITDLINLPEFADPNLPDGEQIPVIGIGNANVIAIPLGDGGNTLYLATGNDVAMVGVAVIIKQLDALGRTILGVNTFVPFQGNGFAGTAGFFTSVNPGESGIGIFLDVKGILDRGDQSPVGEIVQSQAIASVEQSNELVVNEKGELKEMSSGLEFAAYHTGSDKDTEKMDKYLYKLSRKKRELTTVE